jgi:hypothetical protein
MTMDSDKKPFRLANDQEYEEIAKVLEVLKECLSVNRIGPRYGCSAMEHLIAYAYRSHGVSFDDFKEWTLSRLDYFEPLWDKDLDSWI